MTPVLSLREDPKEMVSLLGAPAGAAGTELAALKACCALSGSESGLFCELQNESDSWLEISLSASCLRDESDSISIA